MGGKRLCRPPTLLEGGGLLPAPWLKVISKVVGVGSFDVHGGSRQEVVGATDERKRMDVDAAGSTRREVKRMLV